MSTTEQVAENTDGPDDILSDIRAAMAEVAGVEAEVEPEVIEEAPGVAGADEEIEENPGEAADDAAPEVLAPPKSWTANDAEDVKWDDLPDEVKKVVLRREGERDDATNRALTEGAPARQIYETFQQHAQRIGADPGMVAQALINADNILRNGTPEQKAAALRQIQTDYGIQAATAPAPAQDDMDLTDPDVAALKAELSQVRSLVTSDQQAREQAQIAANDAAIQQFWYATTDSGEPAHPYVDDVAQDMAGIMEVRKAQGMPATPADLESIYDQACRMNDGVWAKIQADRARQQKAEQAAADKAKVEKARRASSSVATSGASAVASKPSDEEPEKASDSVAKAIAELRAAQGAAEA